MPDTLTEDEVSLHPQYVAPFEGDVSPVLFGIEHEYRSAGQSIGADQNDRRFSATAPNRRLPNGWVGHHEHCGWEIKTPPSNNIAEVMTVFRRLEDAYGDRGHTDCGLHVHLNCDPTLGGAANPEQLIAAYLEAKPYLWTIVPNEHGTVGRRSSRYYGARVYGSADEVWRGGTSKYTEIHTGRLSSFGTIEFRLAAATNDMDAFETWVRTLLALAADSVYTCEDAARLVRYEGRPNNRPNFNATLEHNRTTGGRLNRLGQVLVRDTRAYGAATVQVGRPRAARVQAILLEAYNAATAEV